MALMNHPGAMSLPRGMTSHFNSWVAAQNAVSRKVVCVCIVVWQKDDTYRNRTAKENLPLPREPNTLFTRGLGQLIAAAAVFLAS